MASSPIFGTTHPNKYFIKSLQGSSFDGFYGLFQKTWNVHHGMFPWTFKGTLPWLKGLTTDHHHPLLRPQISMNVFCPRCLVAEVHPQAIHFISDAGHGDFDGLRRVVDVKAGRVLVMSLEDLGYFYQWRLLDLNGFRAGKSLIHKKLLVETFIYGCEIAS